MSYDGLFVFNQSKSSSFFNYFLYFKFLLIFSVKMTVLSEIFALSIKKLHWINIFINSSLFFRSMRLHSCSVGISTSGVNSWGKKEVKEGFRDLAWTQNQNGGVSPHQNKYPRKIWILDAMGVLLRWMHKWCGEITFKHPHLDNPCFIFIVKVYLVTRFNILPMISYSVLHCVS